MFKLKKILSVTAAAACMISVCRLIPLTKEEASAAGEMTAFQITRNMEIGWNVGNSLDSTSSASNPGLSTETAWGNPKVTQELINAVKAKGFNTIRIPTTWYQHLDADNNIDKEWMNRVKEVVDYAYKQNMYVILNIHHEEWINRADFATAYDEMSPKLIKIWQQIAAEFADYDQRLIFEGMNEPRAVGTSYEWTGTQAEYEVVNKLNADFIATVRNIASPYKDTRLLMIPDYCASAYDYVYSNMEVPEDDDYIAVSLHAYCPYNFAMNSEVDQSVHENFDNKFKSELDSLFSNMRNYFTDKDIPVVIGEFSASNFNNTEARCEWAEYYISATKKYGIPCVLWDNDAYGNSDKSEDHSYINRSTYEWYPHSEPVVDTMMKVINDDSIVWGSERKAPIYAHPSIDSGKTLYKDAAGMTLDTSIKDGHVSPNYDVSWSVLNGKDVAVKITGDTPLIAFMDGSWNNWTQFSPYHVQDGIAYYSYDAIKAGWTAATEPSHICVMTSGKTTVTQISIIDPPTITYPDVEPITKPSEDKTEPSEDTSSEGDTTASTGPTDPFKFESKSYKIDIPEGSKAGHVVVFTVEGAPGASVGGGIGYGAGEDDWTNIDWSGNLDADGKADFEVFIEDMPDNIVSAEIQIWWSNVWDSVNEVAIDKDCEMTSYKVYKMGMGDVVYGDADLNGELEISDAAKIMSYVTNPEKYPFTEEQLNVSDVYQRGDGVSNMDALSVRKRLAQIISELPESYNK